jgi:hypothetical protein
MVLSSLAVLAAVGIVALAAFVFRKWDRGSDDKDNNGTIARHTGSMLSALFLMAFAIAVVVPWTTADAARDNTQAESQAVIGAYWSAAELPAPVGRQVQQGLRGYVGFVRDSEWDLMRRHERLSPDGWARLDALRAQVVALRAADDRTEDARTTVLQDFQLISEARSRRALDARARPPVALLYLTALTGLTAVLFPYLIGARPRGMTFLPMGAMAALLGFAVYLSFDISHVFSGGLQVKPDAFTAAQQEFPRIPAAP